MLGAWQSTVVERPVRPHGPALLGPAQVALTVFYHTDAANFTSTFFNRTIDVTEVPPLVDLQGLFLLAALAGLLGALGALPPAPLFPSPQGSACARRSGRALSGVLLRVHKLSAAGSAGRDTGSPVA